MFSFTGEWWNRNPIDVVNQATRTGAAPNVSDAFTINGQPGDLYQCSSSGTFIAILMYPLDFKFSSGSEFNLELENDWLIANDGISMQIPFVYR